MRPEPEDEGVTFGDLPYGATGYDPETMMYTWDEEGGES